MTNSCLAEILIFIICCYCGNRNISVVKISTVGQTVEIFTVHEIQSGADGRTEALTAEPYLLKGND